jgi:uncharacterized protein (TIGR00255 family)
LASKAAWSADHQSMTGFARAQGHADCGEASGKWAWEIRSVNGRSLEIRLRLPPGLEALEPSCRKAISAAMARGNIHASLTFERDTSFAVPVVNQAALEAVLSAIEMLRKRTGSPPPAAEAVLNLRGVLEYGEQEADTGQTGCRDAAVMAGLDVVLAELAQARRAEGNAVVAILAEHVDQIVALAAQIRADPSRAPDAIRVRIADQLAPLLESASALDPQRLHLEAAILATKADISEELDRLAAHVDAARSMLRAPGPAGRKLDFLAQEFNRECNTICSKSNSANVTAAGLEMKAVIDRLREQVQNLE